MDLKTLKVGQTLVVAISVPSFAGDSKVVKAVNKKQMLKNVELVIDYNSITPGKPSLSNSDLIQLQERIKDNKFGENMFFTELYKKVKKFIKRKGLK